MEASTPAGQLVDALTAELEAKNAVLSFLAEQFDPQIAEGRWQDALNQVYFLKRKTAAPTVVTCQLTGRNGTNIPYGTLAKSATGQTLLCNRSVTIGPPAFDNGKAETTFRVIQPGAVEIGAHEVNSLLTVVPGLDGIDNQAAGAVGRAQEGQLVYDLRRIACAAPNSRRSQARI